jgi:hypothetical protein
MATVSLSPLFRGRTPHGPLTRFRPLRSRGFPPRVSQSLRETSLYGEVRGEPRKVVSRRFGIHRGLVAPFRADIVQWQERLHSVSRKSECSNPRVSFAHVYAPWYDMSTKNLTERPPLDGLHLFWTSGMKSNTRIEKGADPDPTSNPGRGRSINGRTPSLQLEGFRFKS